MLPFEYGALIPLRPGARLGVFPQRPDTPRDTIEQGGRESLARLVDTVRWRRYRIDWVTARVGAAAAGLADFDDAGLADERDRLHRALLSDGLRDALVFRVFALVREVARRTVHMQHYDVQLFGAWVIVNGHLAEMATGEGKSFTATLAAAAAALAGIPVHIITTNEYLACRDAQEMRPLFSALGLSVDAVTEHMDSATKRDAYGCDIVYCSNKQVAFDYLRDRVIAGNESGQRALAFSHGENLLLRGLCFAIVDEADSVLIDEARTPLILSREHGDANRQDIYQHALALGRRMEAPRDFTYCEREQSVSLTEYGRDWLEEQTRDLDGVWAGMRHAQSLVVQALRALHLFHCNTHYLVRDGKVEIVDRNTGRALAGRSWQHGLHQMIECKESCVMTGQRETLASITYQRFFSRYLRLGGMSGTLREVRGEMRSVYQLRVIDVPLHRICQRRDRGITLHRDGAARWLAVASQLERIHATGQPVLVGTGSVYDSELLSSFLHRRGLAHRTLNARQDQEEAQVVARAGERNQITVATNMAGRGTDIKLGPGVAQIGGLHVIGTECHEEFRVDRQLQGRCGRQGDPGCTETHVALDDPLLERFYPAWLRLTLARRLVANGCLPSWLIVGLLRLPQLAASRRYRSERREVMHKQEQLGRMLAYSGRRE